MDREGPPSTTSKPKADNKRVGGVTEKVRFVRRIGLFFAAFFKESNIFFCRRFCFRIKQKRLAGGGVGSGGRHHAVAPLRYAPRRGILSQVSLKKLVFFAVFLERKTGIFAELFIPEKRSGWLGGACRRGLLCSLSLKKADGFCRAFTRKSEVGGWVGPAGKVFFAKLSLKKADFGFLIKLLYLKEVCNSLLPFFEERQGFLPSFSSLKSEVAVAGRRTEANKKNKKEDYK